MFTNSSQSLTEGGSNQLETMPYEEKVIGWNIETPPPPPFSCWGQRIHSHNTSCKNNNECMNADSLKRTTSYKQKKKAVNKRLVKVIGPYYVLCYLPYN